FFYEVEHMRDPFMPLLESMGPLGGSTTIQRQPTETQKECPHPDPYRVQVGLELLPLDAMQMVGTLEDHSGTLWGLVISRSDGTIHRVKTGDRIGKNFGRIIGIYDDKIEILEMLPDGSGCWNEEITSLALIE
ncbi:MAG: pilus assembly protein PilP, partial [Pseudomonadota bacterium]|nr:pilus assembly protein PilP [Pseudomonadota bacterium]